MNTDENPFGAYAPVTRTAVVADHPLFDALSFESSMDTVANSAETEQSGRVLRYRIVLGNVIAWLSIIIAIRLIFF